MMKHRNKVVIIILEDKHLAVAIIILYLVIIHVNDHEELNHKSMSRQLVNLTLASISNVLTQLGSRLRCNI